jgi:hypothetical protein
MTTKISILESEHLNWLVHMYPFTVSSITALDDGWRITAAGPVRKFVFTKQRDRGAESKFHGFGIIVGKRLFGFWVSISVKKPLFKFIRNASVPTL